MSFVVCTDIDGTLLQAPEHEQLHPTTEEALDRLRGDGVPVIPVTQRPPSSALRVARLIDAPYVVALSGAVVLEVATGHIVRIGPTIRPSAIAAVWGSIAETGATLYAHGHGRWWTSRMDERAERYARRHDLPAPDSASALPRAMNLIEAVGQFRDDYAPPVDDLVATRSQGFQNTYITMLPHRVDKATGMRHVLKCLDRSWDDVIALGDGANDVAMLRAAARGVAVGPAPSDELTSAATHHVALRADDGAVGAALLGLVYDEPEHLAHVTACGTERGTL